MPLFDLPQDQLEAYGGGVSSPPDFDEFWSGTMTDAARFDLDISLEPVETGLSVFETFDVTFAGFGGQPVRAWLHLPAGAANVPVVVQFVGYGGGRGLPHESIMWPAVGVASLIMDTRGQGSGWSIGETADPAGSAPAHPGFMTRGILDRDDYYYRRVFIDGVRAVGVACAQSRIDSTRVALFGASQGGGIALAVAGLVPDVVSLVMCDVPALCDFPRAVDLAEQIPYLEIVNYLSVHRGRRDEVLRTLSYFDGVLLGARGRAPGFFSIALMDRVCPPSTQYAAYNAYGGPKELALYHYNGHEGGGALHQARQIDWLRRRWRLGTTS
ncbi:MAG TPA: acetylxylan esterase [Gaiellaceae bacterium]|nr:acetylxylan esterase [Gaiellaceae bacterium]